MRRIARWLFTLCAAVSLLLCVTLAAFTLQPRTSIYYPGPPSIDVTISRGQFVGRFVEQPWDPTDKFRREPDFVWPGGSCQRFAARIGLTA